MTDTIHLGLPFIEGSQAQKHVTHNEALRALDVLVMPAARGRDLAAPPEDPAEGDRYIVKAPAADAFAGKDNQIAVYDGGAWAFHAPRAGWTCYVEDEAALLTFDGTDWQVATGAVLQNLERLGVGTIADAVNPLAAKLNNALFTAKPVAEGGDGDLRYKLSKEGAGNTVSLLFQDDFSGRAEIGLTGDDDFHVKVSPDGATWIDALTIASADGALSFPASGTSLRRRLVAPRTYYVRPDGSDANDGLSDTAGGAFATPQRAVDVVFGTLDLGGQAVTIQLADGSYGGIAQASPQVGAGTVTIRGNDAYPENVVITGSGSGVHGVTASNGATLTLSGFTVGSASASCLGVTLDGVIYFANLRIGGAPQGHLRASDSGKLRCTGGYSIVGGTGSQAHWVAVGNGIVRVQSVPITLLASATFTNGFAWATTGSIIFGNGCTFTGTATGKQYQVDSNGVLQIASTILPGSLAGTTSTGGQVI